MLREQAPPVQLRPERRPAVVMMIGHSVPSTGRTRTVALVRVLGAITAVLLAIDAYVHFRDAGQYDIATGAAITQGDLFRLQAALAVAVAVAVLVRPHWSVWVVVLLLASSAAGAVFLYTYVDVGRLGPLPNMYEPTWSVPGKRLAAAAEVATIPIAVLGLLLAIRVRSSGDERGEYPARSPESPTRRTD